MSDDLDAPAGDSAPAPEAPSSSPREALEKAFAGVLDDGGAEDVSSEDAPASGPARGPDGRFAPKDAAPETPETPPADPVPAEQAPPAAAADPSPAAVGTFDVPSRFSPDAKAAWEQTPAPVKAEIGRAMRELETGLRGYQERFEPLRPFEDMARQHGTTLHAALSNYVGMEQMLRQDPLKGLELVCRNMGLDFRQVAAHVAGQPVPERDTVIDGLNREIAALKQQVGGVTQTFEQQRQRETTSVVEQFAASHPRFDELSGDIAQMLKTGFASDLEDAYAKAERLNPAPAAPQPPAPAPAPAATPDPAQTRKSDLSIKGAPSSGSNPATRQRSATPAAAVANAFARVGLS